jgi:hypothetical protein
MRIRPIDYMHFCRPEHACYTLPVGWEAGLPGMWLHRISGHAWHRKVEIGRAHTGVRHLEWFTAVGRRSPVSVSAAFRKDSAVIRVHPRSDCLFPIAEKRRCTQIKTHFDIIPA